MSNNDQSEFKVGDAVYYYDDTDFEIISAKITKGISVQWSMEDVVELNDGRTTWFHNVFHNRKDCVKSVVTGELADVDDEICLLKKEFERLAYERREILRAIT